MLRKLIVAIYALKQIFTLRRSRPPKDDKVEVPDQRYTLW